MKILITGGAGFIGINSAYRFIKEEHEVLIYDNLSRCGTKRNIEWLRAEGNFTFIKEDIRDFSKLKETFQNNPDIDVVLHLAAQVAVTLSVDDPRQDFEINAAGTLNVCEAVRQFCPQAIILNASTNKVYGALEDLRIIEKDGMYKYADLTKGIPEKRCLDFHSPYGCSKGAADQYIMDYARIYDIKTVNFRQSCIYGPHQFGIEVQGWLAWFAICALKRNKITIYVYGK
jgi:CDP-paratose 2-epimerase